MQNDYLNINLTSSNKQINNFMQQNVQSERLLENFNYSQQRNSIPSNIPHSQKRPQQDQVLHNQSQNKQLQNHPTHKSISTPSENKIKLIEQEIQNQKQLISILKKQNQLQKQQLENTLNKSFLSLNHKSKIDGHQSQQDQLLETKTQVDPQSLEMRKNQAIKELQNEEQKYRQNIRKIQLKKTQMRRKLKDQQEIPIKIMDFKDLEKKKPINSNQSNHLHINQSNEKPQQQKPEQFIQKSAADMTKKSSQPLFVESQAINEQNQLQSQSLSKANGNQFIQASSIQQKFQVKVKSVKQPQKGKQHSQKASQLSNRKSQNQNSQNSKITQKSNQKKYSVKLSSVIVPQINDSIKEIQQRKSQKRYQNQVLAQSPLINQKDLQEIQKFGSTVKSKVSQAKRSVDMQEANSLNSKQKPILLPQDMIEAKLNPSAKQKTVSAKSQASNKKQQRTQFLYVPHNVKQPSHKSFKKTDKSIQWSEVDISMYGKTNQIIDQSRFSSRINNYQNHMIPESAEVNQFAGIQVNKINMKKSKLINQNNFFETSEKQIKSEKANNLVPLTTNKQKSQKSNRTNSHHNSKGSFIASRQGSVRQKVDRYDRFQRDHSLKSEKVENKLVMIENLNNKNPSNNAPVSYRTRKSTSKQGSILKSRASSVSKDNQNIQQEKQQSTKQAPPMKEESQIQQKESSIVVSKEQMSLLHEHIKKLEEKLCYIEERQQRLAKQKTQEILKLQQLVLQQEKEEQQLKKSIFAQRSQGDIEQNQQEHNNHELNIHQHGAEDQQLIPQVQSVSKQLELPAHNDDIQEQQPTISNPNQQITQPNVIPDRDEQEAQIAQNEKTFQHANKVQQTQKELLQIPKQAQTTNNNNQKDLSKSTVSQRQTIQHEINHISQIQAKFLQEKSQLMDEITRLKKVIRQMQIQKIKSIEQSRSIISRDTKSQKPDHKNDNEGIIINQSKKNRTLEPLKVDTKYSIDQKQLSPFGKIVRNSPGKNISRLTNTFQKSQVSPDKKFRINASKKSSLLSDSIVKQSFQSNDFIPLPQNSATFDDEGNNLLIKKKSQSYPINQKSGYIVLTNENQALSNLEKQPETNLQQQSKQQQSNEMNGSKRSEQAKEEILQRFNRTNRQFNNFVQSSRLINETNSSLSSQNNLFDKTNRSSSFVNNIDNKQLHHSEDDNPENKILHKDSSSRLDLQIVTHENQNFQQSFTRIVDEIKNQELRNESEEENENEIPEIQISSLDIGQLPKTPDISYDQDQLMDLAKQTFNIFDIQVHNDDIDFNMKKYKNCVIFTKGPETILWHYNGKFYIGGWKGKQDGSGEKTGYGVQIVPDKHIYKGQFMNGKKHGTGIMKSTNGNIYDGQWIDGVKSGQGTYYDATTKVIYQGQWKDGKKNGYGVLKFSAKQYYKGTFVKSVKEGYGTEVFVNGDQYRGEYCRGKFHGKGKYSWANTSVFEGDFKEGMRHGHGTWKSSKVNPDIYVGSYENDKKSGYGRYVWSNGCIYEGNFAQDVKHGKGRLIYTDGREIKGVWEEGCLLEAVTQNSKQYNKQEALSREGKFRIK